MKTNSSRGGARKGSGRKPYYNEPTTDVTFKVPVSKKEVIINLVKKQLEKWKKKPVQHIKQID